MNTVTIDRITAQHVELAPKPLVPGVLYISQKYRTAVHLCCCGCGEKVVTPLSPAEWRVQLNGGQVSLQPSIGNATPCRSHYWIRHGRVDWAPPMSNADVARTRTRDRASLKALFTARQEARRGSRLQRALAVLTGWWNWLVGKR